MKPRSPIPKRRSKPRRKRPELTRGPKQERVFFDPRSYVTKGGRVRLKGLDYELLRWNAYMRACDNYRRPSLCECGCGLIAYWPTSMQFISIADAGSLSHKKHGARKSDELSEVLWMRHECHMKSHNCNGKPCPPKPLSYTESTAHVSDA